MTVRYVGPKSENNPSYDGWHLNTLAAIVGIEIARRRGFACDLSVPRDGPMAIKIAQIIAVIRQAYQKLGITGSM